MARYSYPASERNRKINRIVRAITRFHLTHQNTVLLLLGFTFAYLLVKNGILSQLVQWVASFGYISAFAIGFLFSFGSLTVPSSVAFFILAKEFNPIIIALVGAMGATMSSFLIFKFIKNELLNEVRYVLSNDLRLDVAKFEQRVHKTIFKSKFLQTYIPVLSGILTALPLPTETLVAILWTVARYSTKKVLLYAFIFSFIGILGIVISAHIIQ